MAPGSETIFRNEAMAKTHTVRTEAALRTRAHQLSRVPGLAHTQPRARSRARTLVRTSGHTLVCPASPPAPLAASCSQRHARSVTEQLFQQPRHRRVGPSRSSAGVPRASAGVPRASAGLRGLEQLGFPAPRQQRRGLLRLGGLQLRRTGWEICLIPGLGSSQAACVRTDV